MKMEAAAIAESGKSRVAPTSAPGFEIGLSDEKTVSTIPMHEPAPIAAANVDTPATSLKRIDSVPLTCLFSANFLDD
jgi:hypothetical protein